MAKEKATIIGTVYTLFVSCYHEIEKRVLICELEQKREYLCSLNQQLMKLSEDLIGCYFSLKQINQAMVLSESEELRDSLLKGQPLWEENKCSLKERYEQEQENIENIKKSISAFQEKIDKHTAIFIDLEQRYQDRINPHTRKSFSR